MCVADNGYASGPPNKHVVTDLHLSTYQVVAARDEIKSPAVVAVGCMDSIVVADYPFYGQQIASYPWPLYMADRSFAHYSYYLIKPIRPGYGYMRRSDVLTHSRRC